MTPEEQQIAIAEHCGWEHVEEGYGWPLDPGYDRTIYGKGMMQLPDYLNDLNAMHEAEKTLTDEQRRIYGMELGSVLVAKMRAEGCRTAKEFDARPTWLWEATASQRAEAFLRTIGKYKSQ